MLEEKRENWETTAPGDEDREVVSWYTPRAREGREVVSYYVQSTPLPEKARSIAPPEKKKKSRRGLWIFLALLSVLLIVVVVAVVRIRKKPRCKRMCSAVLSLGGNGGVLQRGCCVGQGRCLVSSPQPYPSGSLRRFP